jgi:hypothetical protein
MAATAAATGPRTDEGKAASSRNSLRHGLTATQVVLPGEDPAGYEALRQSLIENHHPAEGLETILVDQIAQCVWRLNRARAIERDVLEQELTAPEETYNGQLERVTRYMASIEREFHRAIRELTNLQSIRSRTTVAEYKAATKEQSARVARQLHDYINAPCPNPNPTHIDFAKRTPEQLRR